MPARPTTIEGVSLTARLWNRYALAVSTQTGDRPTFFAFAAGRTRIAPESSVSVAISSASLYSAEFQSPARIESRCLRLAAALGITPVPEVVLSAEFKISVYGWSLCRNTRDPHVPLQALEAHGWRELAAALADRGLAVVATGSPDEAERSYLDDLWNGMDRSDGSTAEAGPRSQRCYRPPASLLDQTRPSRILPRRRVVRLLRSTGRLTRGYGDLGRSAASMCRGMPRAPSSGEAMSGSCKIPCLALRVGLVQNPSPCTPCRNEDCERRLDSYRRCLDELSVRQVLSAVDQALSVAVPLST